MVVNYWGNTYLPVALGAQPIDRLIATNARRAVAPLRVEDHPGALAADHRRLWLGPSAPLELVGEAVYRRPGQRFDLHGRAAAAAAAAASAEDADFRLRFERVLSLKAGLKRRKSVGLVIVERFYAVEW